MNILVIYDSLFGNTEKIAQAIADGFGSTHTPKLVNTSRVQITDLKGIDVLIVGSPTHGGRAKPELQKFLDQIPANALKGVKVATFDTRFLEKDQTLPLQLLMKTIGYAAAKIETILKGKGGISIAKPEGFIVVKKEGPLADGEAARATAWAKQLPIS